MNIHGFRDKIKGWAGERRQMLVFTAILVGASLISFYLGYVAKAESALASPVVINCPIGAYMASGNPLNSTQIGDLSLENKGNGVNTASSTQSQKGAFVASKNGSKYYPVGCSGASRIKEENKVYFTSASNAEAAGLSLASACK